MQRACVCHLPPLHPAAANTGWASPLTFTLTGEDTDCWGLSDQEGPASTFWKHNWSATKKLLDAWGFHQNQKLRKAETCCWILLFHPGSWPGGQVEECPSTEWSVKPDWGRTHVSRLRPGRWPKLLAPIRTGNSPCRARPYRKPAELHSKGSWTQSEREDKQRPNKKKRERNLTQQGFKYTYNWFKLVNVRVQSACCHIKIITLHSLYHLNTDHKPKCWLKQSIMERRDV